MHFNAFRDKLLEGLIVSLAFSVRYGSIKILKIIIWLITDFTMQKKK